MALITKDNLAFMMSIFQEKGLIDSNKITEDGSIIYGIKKFIKDGNVVPPKNIKDIGEYNTILMVLKQKELVVDVMQGHSIVDTVLYFVEFIDKSEIENGVITKVNV